MILRPRPDLEILLEEDAVAPHRHPAPAPMEPVGRVGMDERAARHDRNHRIGLGNLLGGRRRWEDEGEKEQAADEAEARAEHASGEESNQPAWHGAVSINHVPFTAV